MELSRKVLQRYHWVIISTLFILLGLRSVLENGWTSIVFWPGGYLLTIYLLGTIVFMYGKPLILFYGLRNSSINLIVKSLAFGLGLLLFSDLLTLILERFLRLEEHYSAIGFIDTLSGHWYRVLEGVLIYTVYQGVLEVYYLYQAFLEQERDINHLRSKLDDSKLDSMRAQLNPHFLYNAMNSIAMMVRLKENKKATQMIANLNDFMRVALGRTQGYKIPLSEELGLLDKYIEVEKVRFGEKLEVDKDYDPKIMGIEVPQLILQPIVENVFKHGMKNSLANQKLKISTSDKGHTVEMRVFNTTEKSVSLSQLTASGGLGLPSVILRLRKFYGNQFKLRQEQGGGGVTVSIEIPKK